MCNHAALVNHFVRYDRASIEGLRASCPNCGKNVLLLDVLPDAPVIRGRTAEHRPPARPEVEYPRRFPQEPSPPAPDTKPEVPHEIDLCVALMGPNVDLLFRIFMNSLLRVGSFDDEYKRVTLHVVDNGILKEHLPGVRKLFNMVPVRRWHDVGEVNWQKTNVLPLMTSNAGVVCEWMLDNCGAAQWCCVVHFDVFWKRDMVGSMARRLHSRVGMLGNNAPIMMVNRVAWKVHRVPLTSISEFYAVPIGMGNWQVYHSGDRRAKPAIEAGLARTCGGFDTAQLLEIVLPAHGWYCEPLTDEFESHFTHFTNGSVHGKGGDRNRERQQFLELIKNEKL